MSQHKYFKLVDNPNKYPEFTLNKSYKCINVDNGICDLKNDKNTITSLVLRNISEDFEQVMRKHKYFALELFLEQQSEGITEEQLDNFYNDMIRVVEKHNFICGGGLRPVDKNGNEIKDTYRI